MASDLYEAQSLNQKNAPETAELYEMWRLDTDTRPYAGAGLENVILCFVLFLNVFTGGTKNPRHSRCR